jgi:N-glycosylase/DNA lyase
MLVFIELHDGKKLKLCFDGDLPGKLLDYRLIGSVYNLCFWVDGYKSIIFIPGLDYSVVVLYFNGKYELYSESCCCEDLVKKFHFTIGLNEDIGGLIKLASRDPLLGEFLRTYRGWRLRSTSLWWAIVTGICQQNVSFKQGWRMLHNIVKNYERIIQVGELKVLRPPEPREVLDDPDPLFNSGLGYRAKTVVNVAKAFVNGDVDEEAINEGTPVYAESVLRELKGIGPYTARLAIALSMRKYDLPPIDRWLKKIISVVYGIDEKFAEEFWVEKWRMWSALTSIMVTIALDAEPLNKALQRIHRREILPSPSVKPSPMNMRSFCEIE